MELGGKSPVSTIFEDADVSARWTPLFTIFSSTANAAPPGQHLYQQRHLPGRFVKRFAERANRLRRLPTKPEHRGRR